MAAAIRHPRRGPACTASPIGGRLSSLRHACLSCQPLFLNVDGVLRDLPAGVWGFQSATSKPLAENLSLPANQLSSFLAARALDRGTASSASHQYRKPRGPCQPQKPGVPFAFLPSAFSAATPPRCARADARAAPSGRRPGAPRSCRPSSAIAGRRSPARHSGRRRPA